MEQCAVVLIEIPPLFIIAASARQTSIVTNEQEVVIGTK